MAALRRLSILAIPLALLLTGCTTPGLLYTDITQPLTRDMNRTPRAEAFAANGSNAFREPFTRVRAEWSGYGLGKAARQGGIDVVHYADIRRQSILGGLFSRTTIEVYGIRTPEGEPGDGLLSDPDKPPGSALPPP
jgi:hypothetical protein